MRSLTLGPVSAIAVFFFSSRRRHTRLQGDWSSDVCSSDLEDQVDQVRDRADDREGEDRRGRKSGRAAWRGRGEKSVVAVSLKKKKRHRTVVSLTRAKAEHTGTGETGRPRGDGPHGAGQRVE